ncbi:MerR family transcriptional regulator [Intrasporangium sp. YIM S08009]|uniref:MerR family transcriptional regulator n=1 Tax=Intrasporangium zincisolvens TaxID=3080018 RepID=UPI002B05AE2F|nr:MerR family transcriptional regulator [Intrasporangium sp. YIM S08009]
MTGAARRSDPSTPGAPVLSTRAVADASGYSVQQVRVLEGLGVVPPADRAANGYRWFRPEHVLALRAYRRLADAVGPVVARRVLADVRTLPLDEAAARVSALHVGLTRQRDEALAARRALALVRDEASLDTAATGDSGGTEDPDAMTITELARALGVRTSTLRFWEREGLVAPERVGSGSVRGRRYPVAAIREARVAAALRSAGHPVPAVREVVASLRRLAGPDTPPSPAGTTGAAGLDPDAALQRHLDAIARRTLALVAAGADVVRLLTDEVGAVEPTDA